jgi:uncharacterized membrane protein YidH (DUF202 family)
MLGILIGLLPIGLGIKAFTRDGLPLTRSKNLKGAGAKTIGVICILVGLAFIADGTFRFIPSLTCRSKAISAHLGEA